MFSKDTKIEGYDEALWAAMQHEVKRQEEHIELIASENYASQRVMQAQGSVLTNKYAEGYPARRYYGGCENVDVAEQLANAYRASLVMTTILLQGSTSFVVIAATAPFCHAFPRYLCPSSSTPSIHTKRNPGFTFLES